jgi:hypothetical protein
MDLIQMLTRSGVFVLCSSTVVADNPENGPDSKRQNLTWSKRCYFEDAWSSQDRSVPPSRDGQLPPWARSSVLHDVVHVTGTRGFPAHTESRLSICCFEHLHTKRDVQGDLSQSI